MDAPIQAEPHFSWLREFGIPAFFTLFGAMLGFIVGQIRDEWRAKRAKQSFMRAIGMELDALSNQLDASLYEVQGSAERIRGRSTEGVQFAWALRTSVFTSQIAKLRDVDDSLMIEVIHFYSDLGTLEHIFRAANDVGNEYSRADIFSGEKDKVRPRLSSTLTELQNQIRAFGNRLTRLRAKLPSGATSQR